MNLPSFPNIDLFSARRQRLVRRAHRPRPSHNRGYSVAGLLIFAFFGGIGGGVARDVLLREIPSPLQHPIYLFVCILMGLLGLALSQWAETKEEWFRARLLAHCKSFSLPWFAILARTRRSSTTGDLRRDLRGPPRHHRRRRAHRPVLRGHAEVVRPAEHLVTTAVLSAGVYAMVAWAQGSLEFFHITLIAALTGFLFRVFAVRDHWKQAVPVAGAAAGPRAPAARG